MSSLYERAAIIPGRSMTRSKSPDRLRRAWAAGGRGAILYDVDGREYIDMVCGLGAISLGYVDRHPRHAGVYSLPHAIEIEAAEAILKHVAPWASCVKTVKTGSEATHAAYRVAKAATGRPYVLIADGAYHGWHEWTDAAYRFPVGYDFGPRGYFTIPDPNGHGCRTFADEAVAAVFVEPPRFAPVDVDWLKAVRRYCTKRGALLVFDEMIWGGRWALGGCSEYTGVIPDLACYGKAFANGEAAAFVVGNQELASAGEIVSGTFSGDTTGLQSVVDTLRIYASEPVIDTLWKRAKYLYEGFSDAVPSSFCTLSQAAPLMGLNFVNPEHKVPFKDQMAGRGVLMWPDWLMVNYSHTEELLERVIKAAGGACRTLS